MKKDTVLNGTIAIVRKLNLKRFLYHISALPEFWFQIKKGIIEKISYERRAYELVDYGNLPIIG